MVRKENADEGEEVEIEEMGFKDYGKKGEREIRRKGRKQKESEKGKVISLFIFGYSLGHQSCVVS